MDPANLSALPPAISPERLAPYISQVHGDHDRALRLYTWNIEIAAAFWGPLHVVEVAFRNAVHNQMTQRFARADWWHHPNVHLHAAMTDQLTIAESKAQDNAKRRRRPRVAGDVVAELSFGFWSGFLGRGGPQQYETRYWQPFLHRAFPSYSGPRGPLHRQLENVRLFRNRVAHHEPIFNRHLQADHQTILRLAGYLHPDIQIYIGANSRVPPSLKRRDTCTATGTDASF